MPAQWEFQVGPKKICKTRLGTGHATKTDEFSEKVQRGGGIFSIQKIILQVLDLNKWFFSRRFPKKMQYEFPKMRGGMVRPFGILLKNHLIWQCDPSPSKTDISAWNTT